MKVAVVGEAELVRSGIWALLHSGPHAIDVVDQDQVGSSHVDIALYDPVAPKADQRCTRLLADPSVSRVAAYTWNFQPWLADALFRRGVSAYLSKNAPAVELVAALRAVQSGRQGVVLASRQGRAGGWAGSQFGLTAREAEILALITLGLSNVEIAQRMVVSINSVKSYIRSCYRKIGVETRSQAVLWGSIHAMDRHQGGAEHPVGPSGGPGVARPR